MNLSVEAFVIAALVQEGTPKKAFQANVLPTDFTIYEEEYQWICAQAERQRVINWRRFQQAFPEFEKVVPNENTSDLLDELKSESGFMQVQAALEQAHEELTPDNYMEQADFLKEVLSDVMRVHSPSSDVMLTGNSDDYMRRMKELTVIRDRGETPGIPTKIATLDAHWGGLQSGRVYLALGRPGDAKSFTLAKFNVEGFLAGYRMAVFSPEMNEDEHRARVATLISADPRVQEELGLTKAFRNRAIMDGRGYNYKAYRRLWKWIEEQPGAITLFTQKWRMAKMTPAYIESKIKDLGIQCVTVDPIYKLKASARVRGDDWQRLAYITDELCDLAKSHNIPLLMSNQAHRQQGNRGDAPHKDNSFGSDAPVQEADYVFGVKHISEERKLVLRCTKSRWGEDFRVDVKFVPNVGVFDDVSKFKPDQFYNGHEDGSTDLVKDAIADLEKDMGDTRKA